MTRTLLNLDNNGLVNGDISDVIGDSEQGPDKDGVIDISCSLVPVCRGRY